jgi:hypothetical protein
MTIKLETPGPSSLERELKTEASDRGLFWQVMHGCRQPRGLELPNKEPP